MRVNLTFIIAVLLLVPLLIPRLPAKGLNACLFFIAFPVIGFFLLHGGGVFGYSVSAVIVSVLLFLLGAAAFEPDGRALIASLACFAGVGIVVAAMGLDHGELPVVDTRLWGGLLVTLVVSVTGIVTSMPVGIALALGPTFHHPADPDFFRHLHRILARRAADHGAVFRDLHAAAVRSHAVSPSTG